MHRVQILLQISTGEEMDTAACFFIIATLPSATLCAKFVRTLSLHRNENEISRNGGNLRRKKLEVQFGYNHGEVCAYQCECICL